MSRAARWAAVAAIGAAGMAMGGAGIQPVQPDIVGSYVDVRAPDAGLPAGTLTTRSHDGQTADRGPAGPRRAERHTPARALGRTTPAQPPASAPPEDASRHALERAGRMSAPCTAPPILS